MYYNIILYMISVYAMANMTFQCTIILYYTIILFMCIIYYLKYTAAVMIIIFEIRSVYACMSESESGPARLVKRVNSSPSTY